ncbi:uncharacterized protein LOC126774721 [Nymphalis io]|uniref:uncharacterized protein LOC126774721 n=1 Tax=Inachis io TaxID=171585 RepID=UPI00216A3BAC|nr:uncharacterized protein LOC126774721 [Nymphalis io]
MVTEGYKTMVAAVARAGNCSPDSVRCGVLHRGPGYMGMVRVTCPLTAAKKISDAGRLFVGWSSAKVCVLEQHPLRCFKCMGLGHTKVLCPSKAERGGLCFRCGVDGHKSAGCTEKLRCAVCADAGKPSGHVMGSGECNPPHHKGYGGLRHPDYHQCRTAPGRGGSFNVNMSTNIKFLQTNVNHCAAAQDLLLQSMAEWQIDLAVACEPYYVPPLPNWLGDLDGTVVVTTRSETSSLSLIERSSGYVVAGWREFVVVGTYFSPNRGLAEFQIYLGSIRAAPTDLLTGSRRRLRDYVLRQRSSLRCCT